MSETTAHDDRSAEQNPWDNLSEEIGDDPDGPIMTTLGIDLSNVPYTIEEVAEGHDVLYEDDDQLVLRCSESFELQELAKDMSWSFDNLRDLCRLVAREGETERYMVTVAKTEGRRITTPKTPDCWACGNSTDHTTGPLDAPMCLDCYGDGVSYEYNPTKAGLKVSIESL